MDFKWMYFEIKIQLASATIKLKPQYHLRTDATLHHQRERSTWAGRGGFGLHFISAVDRSCEPPVLRVSDANKWRLEDSGWFTTCFTHYWFCVRIRFSRGRTARWIGTSFRIISIAWPLHSNGTSINQYLAYMLLKIHLLIEDCIWLLVIVC